jgi:gamma-glutamyl-gamma-aminobutyrate hydrolase PuuD
MRKVFVVKDGFEYRAVTGMFIEAGWETTDILEDADLVQFVGGADVSPNLYGDKPHRTTHANKVRDDDEMKIYFRAVELGIPMAGICRGGQFLNVMNGGRMFQDVTNHSISGTHKAWLKDAMLPIDVTSTHHQMMIVNKDVEHDVLMLAGVSNRKIEMNPMTESNSREIISITPIGSICEVEAVYYPENQCLCFQPHPEYHGSHVKETREVYFKFINELIFNEQQQEQVA